MDGEWKVVRRRQPPKPAADGSKNVSAAPVNEKNREKNQKKRAARKRAKARQAPLSQDAPEGVEASSGEEDTVEFPAVPPTQGPKAENIACTEKKIKSDNESLDIAAKTATQAGQQIHSQSLKEGKQTPGETKAKAPVLRGPLVDAEKNEEEDEDVGPVQPPQTSHTRTGSLLQNTLGWMGGVFGRRAVGGASPQDQQSVEKVEDSKDDTAPLPVASQSTPSASQARARKSQTSVLRSAAGPELSPKDNKANNVQKPVPVPSSKAPEKSYVSKVEASEGPPAAASGREHVTSGAILHSDWKKGKFLLTAFPGEAAGGGGEHGGHNEHVSDLAMLEDLVASGGWDCTVKLWKWVNLSSTTAGASQLRPLRMLRGHTDRVECVSFLNTGGAETARVASSGRDCTLRLWNSETGACLAKPYIYESARCLAAVPPPGSDSSSWESREVVVGTQSGKVLLWDIEASKPVHSMKGYGSEVTCMANVPLSEDAGSCKLAAGSADGVVRVLDVRLPQQASALEFRGHSGRVYSLRFGGGRFLYVGDFSGSVKVHDVRKGGASKASSDGEGGVSQSIPIGERQVGVRAPIAGMAAGHGLLVSSAAGFWDDDDDDVEGCLQFHALGSDGGGAYLYTVRPGGALLSCMEMNGRRIVTGDVNGTVCGLDLVKKGEKAVGDGKTVVPVEGKALGGCRYLSDSEDEDDDDDAEDEE